LRLLFLVVVLIMIAGCGGDGRVLPEGVVEFPKGTPIAKGSIRFFPGPGGPASEGSAPIVAGKFKFAPGTGLLPGKYKVTVSSAIGPAGPEDQGMPGAGGMKPQFKDLPAKYSSTSETKLQFEVAPNNPLSIILE
jgi:hypothetical protein